MTNETRLAPGDFAPDIAVMDAHDQPVLLSSLWGDGPTLLTFLRHFG
jgi:hypothetical protein